jgi:hypothetical protein
MDNISLIAPKITEAYLMHRKGSGKHENNKFPHGCTFKTLDHSSPPLDRAIRIMAGRLAEDSRRADS